MSEDSTLLGNCTANDSFLNADKAKSSEPKSASEKIQENFRLNQVMMNIV